MKVAVIGLWSETHDLAPWSDPTWKKWALGWDKDVYRADRAFEMHQAWEWPLCCPADYIQRMQMMPDLHLQEAHAELPEAKVYPFDEVAETTGAYWSSSVGYMTALAIHEGAEEIGLWGVAMEGNDEYAYQRPNMEYLVGLARGKGIKVHIPEQSPLCRYGGQFGYVGRYGKKT